MRNDLEAIARGEDIDIPRYLLNGTGVSVPKSMHIKSDKIIIVEGVATMYEPIQDIFDIKIFVEADEEIRKERFMSRAVNARNQDLENAQKHWEYVLDAGKKYIIPSRDNMDIILNGDCNLPYFTQILEYLYTITNNFQQPANND
jgi:uridine kinase